MENVASETEGGKPDAVPAGKPRRKRNHAGWGRIIKQVLACMVLAGLAYGCFQLSQRYVLQSVQVAGGSMSPTLPDSHRYLLNRLAYLFREPKPEDIVVLQDPEDKGYAVKRIVAKPGDSVYVNAGQIFVNGKLLKEPYLAPDTKTFASPKYSAQFWICGAHQYFVLGDNRNNSTDSRMYGAVPQQNILGMVFP
jgi:signal peptidase I